MTDDNVHYLKHPSGLNWKAVQRIAAGFDKFLGNAVAPEVKAMIAAAMPPWFKPGCDCDRGIVEVVSAGHADVAACADCLERIDPTTGERYGKAYGDLDAARWLVENDPAFKGWHVGWEGRPEDDPYPDGAVIAERGAVWVTTLEDEAGWFDPAEA